MTPEEETRAWNDLLGKQSTLSAADSDCRQDVGLGDYYANVLMPEWRQVIEANRDLAEEAVGAVGLS